MIDIFDKKLFLVLIIILVMVFFKSYNNFSGKYFHNLSPYIMINGPIPNNIYIPDVLSRITNVRIYNNGDNSPINNFKIIRNPGQIYYQAVFDIPLNDLEITNVGDPFPPFTVWGRDIEIKVTSPYFNSADVWYPPVFFGPNTLRVEVDTVQSSGPYVSEITYELVPDGGG